MSDKRKIEMCDRYVTSYAGWLLPSLDGIVAEGHVVHRIILIPLGGSIAEQDILSKGMDLPEFERRAISRAADAILRVIVLVRVQWVKIFTVFIRGLVGNAAGIARQDISGRVFKGRGVDRGKTAGGHERRADTVEIIERSLHVRGQLHI